MITSDTREAELRLTNLFLSPQFQVRCVAQPQRNGLFVREESVRDYQALLEDGEDLGLLEVIEEVVSEPGQPLNECATTGRLILVDGYHRWEANRRLGRETVRCRVRRGDELTALLLAAQSNGGRGLQYSHADKLQVAEKVLKALAAHGITWSDVAVARLAGINRITVARVREDLSSRFHIPKERQVTRNGQSYNMRPSSWNKYVPDPDLDGLPDAYEIVERPQKRSSRAAQPKQRQKSDDVPRTQSFSAQAGNARSESSDRRPTHQDNPAPLLNSHQQSGNLSTVDHTDQQAEGLAFTLSWRDIENGQVRQHGITNHTMPASTLPDSVRRDLHRWLLGEK